MLNRGTHLREVVKGRSHSWGKWHFPSVLAKIRARWSLIASTTSWPNGYNWPLLRPLWVPSYFQKWKSESFNGSDHANLRGKKTKRDCFYLNSYCYRLIWIRRWIERNCLTPRERRGSRDKHGQNLIHILRRLGSDLGFWLGIEQHQWHLQKKWQIAWVVWRNFRESILFDFLWCYKGLITKQFKDNSQRKNDCYIWHLEASLSKVRIAYPG